MSVVVPLAVSIPGPWGPVHVAATARGVVAVEWLVDGERFDAGLRHRLGQTVEAASEAHANDARLGHLRVASDALETLLDGRPPAILPPFDLADRPVWDRRVLLEVARIRWGETASYGEIARRIGAAGAARAVGGALGRNPISLLIPCHRVIAADGTLGGYGGDGWGSRDERLAIKRELLGWEGIDPNVAGPVRHRTRRASNVDYPGPDPDPTVMVTPSRTR
jgi:methylated-DNA-[protein]-cysteine S-methyltransferase